MIPRFYPILDTVVLDRAGLEMVRAAEALLDSGARILQLRHKGHFSRDLFERAEKIAELCREAAALFIVNDRADMAALLGAGLHLGQDDLSPVDARKLVPQAMLGLSAHNERQLRAAASEPAGYLALGPIFATASKLKPDPVLGLAELRRLRPLTQKPLVAIGGISLNAAGPTLDAGADSIAVISDLFPEACTLAMLRLRAKQWLQTACT